MDEVIGSLDRVTLNATLNAACRVFFPAVFETSWDYAEWTTTQVLTQPEVTEEVSDPMRYIVGSLTYSFATQAPLQQAGDYAPLYGGDFFNRLHYAAISINLGNVFQQQEQTYWIWNAYQTGRTLLDIASTPGLGVSIIGDQPPLFFDANEVRTFTIAVSQSGPPVISATFSFVWEDEPTVELSIVGLRALVWAWRPDWSASVVERLEWRTDVLQSYRGQEQRRSLRRAPRRSVEFRAGATDAEKREMEAALWGWGARPWAMPLWWDGSQLTEPAFAGSDRVYCDTTKRELLTGTSILLFADWNNYELAQIADVQDDNLLLLQPLSKAWPANATVFPLRTARIEGGLTLERFDGQTMAQRMRWQIDEAVELVEEPPPPYVPPPPPDPPDEDYVPPEPPPPPPPIFATHNGYPVLDTRPNWTAEPSTEHTRKLQILDAIVGRRSIEDEALIPLVIQRQKHTFTSKTEVTLWKKRMLQLRGKAESFYLPTWNRDFIPLDNINARDTSMRVQTSGHARYSFGIAGRRDIAIVLRKSVIAPNAAIVGPFIFAKIATITEVGDGTDLITFAQTLVPSTSVGDPAFGSDFLLATPDGVEAIMFMMLSRMESDAVDLAWWINDVAECSIAVRGFNHNV